MAGIEALSCDLIERTLRHAEYRFMKDQDGDYNLRFGPTPDRNISLSVWLILSGSNKDILEFRTWTDKRYERSDWGKCIGACNTWNNQKRWPKADLNTLASSGSEPASISLEYDYMLSGGASMEQVEQWLGVFITASSAFWSWALNEQGL